MERCSPGLVQGRCSPSHHRRCQIHHGNSIHVRKARQIEYVPAARGCGPGVNHRAAEQASGLSRRFGSASVGTCPASDPATPPDLYSALRAQPSRQTLKASPRVWGAETSPGCGIPVHVVASKNSRLFICESLLPPMSLRCAYQQSAGHRSVSSNYGAEAPGVAPIATEIT